MKVFGLTVWYEVVILLAFYCYGTGRTMHPEYGFSVTGFLMGLYITLLGCGLVFGLVYILTKLVSVKYEIQRNHLLVSVLFIICGIAFSEGIILFDEKDFRSEAELNSSSYQRNRICPFSSSSLIYYPSKGIYACD